MTKTAYLTAYRTELRARYPWAADEAKLDRYMAGARAGLDGAGGGAHTGEASEAAWRRIGGTGKITLKALRKLPDA